MTIVDEAPLAGLRRARLAKTIRETQRASQKRFPGGISLSKVNAVIAAVRKERKKRGN
jgi:hypothetical protein